MKERKIKCFIVDDEEMAIKVIKSHLEHIPNFEVVGVFHSGVEAFLALERKTIDVLFLDIQMPKVTGIEMLKMIEQRPLTVLTTAHREYALEGFELEVVDYLMKPIGLNRFLQTISRVKKRLFQEKETIIQNVIKEETQSGPDKKVSSNHIFIKTNRAYQKIDFEDILHIEAIKNHIKIITKLENHISLIALSEFKKQLPEYFLRVHRSFIVNTRNIVRFDNYSIQNKEGEVPIGRTYKENTLNTLKSLINPNTDLSKGGKGSE